MAMQKVILYYCFTPISDLPAMQFWQQTLCETLGLKGRIVISKHGINGTLGGEMDVLKQYVHKTKLYPGFKKTEFKWSKGTGNDFPRLQVRIRDELVAFGNPDIVEVDGNGVVGGGIHLRPEEVDALVAERGDEVVFFDGRNAFEAKIGKFTNAIIPNTESSRDFVEEIESGKYDHIKDKPVITYCTGGIRCEILSSVMKKRGFKEVYQMKGGIVRYGKKFGDKSLWEGSLFTFDDRLAIDFSSKAKVIGKCESCNSPTKQFYNCQTATCHELVLLCDECAKKSDTKNCIHDKGRKYDPEFIG